MFTRHAGDLRRQHHAAMHEWPGSMGGQPPVLCSEDATDMAPAAGVAAAASAGKAVEEQTQGFGCMSL